MGLQLEQDLSLKSGTIASSYKLISYTLVSIF